MNTTDALLISALEYETNGDQVEQDISAVIEPYTDLSLDTLREHIQDDAFNIMFFSVKPPKRQSVPHIQSNTVDSLIEFTVCNDYSLSIYRK